MQNALVSITQLSVPPDGTCVCLIYTARINQESTRERLRRKLDKKRGAVGAALAKLEAEEMRQHADRFGNQWQYY